MKRISQNSTRLGIVSVLMAVAGLYTGTIGMDAAGAAIANGLGLILTDA